MIKKTGYRLIKKLQQNVQRISYGLSIAAILLTATSLVQPVKADKYEQQKQLLGNVIRIMEVNGIMAITTNINSYILGN